MATSKAGKVINPRRLYRCVDNWKRVSLKSQLCVKYRMCHVLEEMGFKLKASSKMKKSDSKPHLLFPKKPRTSAKSGKHTTLDQSGSELITVSQSMNPSALLELAVPDIVNRLESQGPAVSATIDDVPQPVASETVQPSESENERLAGVGDETDSISKSKKVSEMELLSTVDIKEEDMEQCVARSDTSSDVIDLTDD